VMEASKLKEAVGDRYRPALARTVLFLVLPGVGLRMASAAGCMRFSN
jgi:hypothetical protein